MRSNSSIRIEAKGGGGAVILIDVAQAGKGQSSYARWLVSQKILSVEELETLPVGIKPRTSHFRSPGVERERERERDEGRASARRYLPRKSENRP